MSEGELVPLNGGGGREECCENCVHYYPHKNQAYGQCRVIAPGRDPQGWAVWPKVHGSNPGCSLRMPTGMEVDSCDPWTD